MNRFALLLASGVLLAGSTTAQTTGTATVRTPCTAPAPPGSLVPRQLDPKTFVANANDVVVMEVEHQAPTGNWVEETSATGFGGDSYFRWNGPNHFGTPGNGPLMFRFDNKIKQDYFIRVHVRHDDPDSSEENDCWARLDNESWKKLFHNTGPSSVGVWTFNGRYEETGDFPRYNDLSVGVHEFQISGRSTNFKIDRVHVVPVSTWFANLADEQTDVLRHHPVIGKSFKVSIDDPTDSLGLNPPTTLTMYYGGIAHANFPCGQVFPFGEVMMALSGPSPTTASLAKGWSGPGFPSNHPVPIPNDPALVGMQFTTQGVMFDTSAGIFQMTDALDLVIGDI